MALSLAVSSSDAERGFSHMNEIKEKRHGRMGHDLLNYLMWFKINVSDNVFEFPSLHYTKKWLEAGFMLVDDPMPPTKRRKLADFYFDEENYEDKAKVLSGRSTLFQDFAKSY